MSQRLDRPARVLQLMAQELKTGACMNGYRISPPAWFNAVSAIPPAETMVRTSAYQHRGACKPSKRKPKNIYRPQTIRHPEDNLRATFFQDHPWELARPRVIVESNGMDHQRRDWSKPLYKSNAPAYGESVVQRQMWLMQNNAMSKAQAYDMARQEFYFVRQKQDIERRVAVEEARWTGAYFGTPPIDVGMMLEDHVFEKWKSWAGKQLKSRTARLSADIDTFGMGAEEESDQGPVSQDEVPQEDS
ncbi:hypothetical protein CDD81_2896 [Ophiocordyceps australis]|uniref:Small ribosomal subunit protein mS23 n=1 Tax=Ophiocordyceps australis TaxID=1399860 RepID=A0A2C5XXU8_9HYPO|nr:hypothetical protein CDD81_2896 [Ophiocordyceps australis]